MLLLIVVDRGGPTLLGAQKLAERTQAELAQHLSCEQDQNTVRRVEEV